MCYNLIGFRNERLEPAPPRRPLRLLRLGDGVEEVFCGDGVGAAAHGQQRALIHHIREVRAREAVRARRDAVE